ncbi:acyl carrier protein [Actinomadura sp. GTD37]|uniref:acyl carrier protein n=1 Tax=Actinomadura sp. GTD37 TaxID=1778030 RepID=UPI0035C01E9C
MEYEDVLAELIRFFEEHVPQAAGGGLEPDTPLLEWGILTSLTMVRLVGFILAEFGLHVPPEQIVGANFRTLAALTRLVLDLAADPAARA